MMEILEVSEARPPQVRLTGWTTELGWVTYSVSTAVFLLATTATRPIFISDTMHYLATADPGSAEFWDFGHLFWRPTLRFLLQHISAADQASKLLHAFYIVNFLSTVAGLVGVCLAIATLRIFTHEVAPAVTSTIILSFSQVVLTHSKGGCAYIFGFVALSAGFYTALASAQVGKPVWRSVALGGAFFALAVCLWLPYFFALPGAVLGPVLLCKSSKRPWRVVWGLVIVCATLVLIAYGMVAAHIGIRNFNDFVGWAGRSSHGVTTSGAKRVIFGFARSFVSLGENGPHGIVFKRFLLHDPYNPVSFRQIFGSTLWKLILFYLALGFILVTLRSTPVSRGAGVELLSTSVPVLGFAVAWAGTDLERYLPMFPALVLAVGLALSVVKLRSTTAVVVAVFVATLVITNVASLTARAREQQLRELSFTVRSLNELIPAESLVLLPPAHPLQRIYWDFPESLPLAKPGLKLETIVDLGVASTSEWRARVCTHMSQRWRSQTAVVVDSSLLASAPRQDSSWVEGDDPRVSWRDIYGFFGKLETGGRVGDTDFVRIPATPRNTETIDNCR